MKKCLVLVRNKVKIHYKNKCGKPTPLGVGGIAICIVKEQVAKWRLVLKNREKPYNQHK